MGPTVSRIVGKPYSAMTLQSAALPEYLRTSLHEGVTRAFGPVTRCAEPNIQRRSQAAHWCMEIEKVECLLCHVMHSESFAGNPSRWWRSAQCGQHWDDARVATVMNYRRWLKAAGATAKYEAAA